LHMTQLMPLPLTVSCFSKIQIGFTFLVPAHPGSPGQRAIKQVCVCVLCMYYYYYTVLNYTILIAMVDVDDSCQISADSQPKLTGLV